MADPVQTNFEFIKDIKPPPKKALTLEEAWALSNAKKNRKPPPRSKPCK